MAKLTYNGVELQIDRTVNFAANPIYSDDGVDYLYTHIAIEMSCVFNPYLPMEPLGVLRAVPRDLVAGAVPGVAPPGLFLGQAMDRYLKEMLEVPRKRLTYTVGNDVVIDIQPEPEDAGIQCDCNNGPKPRGAKVLQITGDKTALVIFAIDCWVSDCANIVLSNRWSIRSYTDENAFTTRYISGVAKLRADLMRLNDLNADSFRRAYFPPVPEMFQRKAVSVDLSSDGTELSYDVVDQELALATGTSYLSSIGVTSISGAVTAGQQIDISEKQRVLSAVLSGGPGQSNDGGVWSSISKWIGGASPVGVAHAAWNQITYNRATCTITVQGNRKSQKSNLAQVAGAIAMERLFFSAGFVTNLASTILVSAYLTQSIEERKVTLHCEVLPKIFSKFGGVTLNFGSFMNLSNAINGSFNGISLNIPAGDGISQTGPGPYMGGVNNDRGTWLGALLVQALGINCAVPDPVPQNEQTDDIGFR